MKILRLSTLSMAIAVFALGYNSSFADPKNCGGQHCNHGDDPGFPTDITVELIGGAFAFHHGPQDVTADSAVKLEGDDPIHMDRPGADPALFSWNMVFDLCSLLDGPTGLVDVSEFTVPAGRKPWTVAKVGERVSVGLRFELDSHLASSDPLFTSEPLSVALHLTGACLDLPDCGLIPEVGEPKEITLDGYSIHLKAKGGIAHQAFCHASDGYPSESALGDESTLIITAQ